MDEPLVSVIMPAYNAQNYIKQAIESVQSQTYKNWELLITDDRSIDNTQEIVEQYVAKDPRIKLFINESNSGAGVARNNSIANAKGRFIAFLDADDQWLAEKLTKQISFMLDNGYAFTFTGYQKLQGSSLKGIVIPPVLTNYKKLLSSNVIGCLTAVYDVKTLGKMYMPLIRKRQDMGLWLSILKEVKAAYSISESLAIYRVDSGMSQNKLEILKWQWLFYREVVKLNIFKATYHFFIYSVKGFLKHKK
ncbi:MULTISPECIES: glycosyltransferase family 2 protein [unclassified Pseudoalteromonas]|jgi:glycosyltransferase involved in cell wall biosynthesis|uniref:glycosyltransferase family 2 protein n=1 Tax=unclassified Pseudoalteromonas TaxID=194690 RepID=UPI0018CE84EA|nr:MULTISPECIES: glycosyltransferase family 2 protein [unclassified Pseudoalteromonas]MBH0031570.1 glycosyltransferase family 2 protein [Pseudoalteromonas sp. SWYJZ98]MBH0087479.1 glycosyltransferase family 2 protein [Pseudoalteromonas sp. NSLLW218]